MENITVFTKKQLGYVLKLLKKNLNNRGALSTLIISREGYLSFMDNYQLHTSKEPLFEKLDHYRNIEYEYLLHWYKLHTSKDELKTDKLKDMIIIDEHKFDVNIERLIPTESQSIDSIGFSVKYMELFNGIIGTETIKYNFYGELSPIKAENDLFESILMPVKLEVK